MADIAALGISINSSAVIQATSDLDALVGGANRATEAIGKLAGASKDSATAQASASATQSQASEVTRTTASAADRLIASLQKQIELFNASDAAIAQYNAQAAKATAAQTEQIVTSAALLSQLQAENAQRVSYYAATEAATAAGQRFVASLRTQAETLGFSKDQMLEYKAAQLGVTEEAAPFIAAIAASADATRAQAAADLQAAASARERAEAQAGTISTLEALSESQDRFLAGLRTQIETVGLSTSELQAYRAAQLGIAEEAGPLIAALEAQRNAMAAARTGATSTAGAGESEEAAAARYKAIAVAAQEWAAAQSEAAAIAESYAASVDEVAAAATRAEAAEGALAARVAATSEVLKAQTAAMSLASQAAAGVGTTGVAAGASADETGALDKTTAALQRQLFALTATRAELVAYDAEMAGASQAETDYAVAIARSVEARQAEVALAAEMAAALAAEAAASQLAIAGTSTFTRELLVIFRELSEGRMTYAFASFTKLLSLTSLLSVALNPVTIAVGVLGFAAVKGAEEFDHLNTALITSGNYAGKSAGDLLEMAKAVGNTGENFNNAIEAFTKLSASGRFTADQVREIGTAATAAADQTGVSVDKVVQDFVKLQEDPVKASAALNDQYHYLTLAVYDQIDALAKQGDQIDAVQVASDAYANALESRRDDEVANIGYIEKAWLAVKNATIDAAEAMKGIGRPQTPQEELAAAQQTASGNAGGVQFGETATNGVEQNAAQSRVYQLENEVGSQRRNQDLQSSYVQTQQAGVNGQKTLDRLQNEYDKRGEIVNVLKQQAEALKAVQTAGGTVQPGQGADLTAAIQKRGEPHGGTALANAQQQQPISLLKDQFDQQNKLLADQREILDNDHKARQESDKNFYDQENQLNDQDLANKLAYYTKLEALLRADIASSSTSSLQKIKDQNALAAAVADANVAIAKYSATSVEIADQVTAANNKQSDSVNKYIQSLNDQIAKEQEANERRESAAGVTSRQRSGANESDGAYAQRINSQGAQQISDIQARTAPGTSGLSDDQIQKLVADVQAADAAMVANHKAATQEITQADQDWESGAEKAWTAWSAQASNLTGQVNTATTNLLNGLTDNLLKFAETGKANFQQLADSFVGALAKMEIQAAESKIFGLINGALPGGSGSGALGLLSSLLGSTSSAAGLGLGAGIGADVAGAAGGIADAAGVGLGSQFAGLATGFSTGLPLAAGFADGGHVVGPGSSTSDSIPARLSNGEFVVNASATAQHRPLLEALNGGRGSPGQTHFATGGLVSGGNGQNGAGTNISFNITSTNASGQQDNSPQAQNNAASLHKQLEAAVIEIVRKNSQPGGQINSVIRTAVTQ